MTANPTIFAKAIEGSDACDKQFAALSAAGTTINDAYWELVIDDVRDALALLRPTHDESGGADGFLSIEVAPELDTDGTIAAAHELRYQEGLTILLGRIEVAGSPEDDVGRTLEDQGVDSFHQAFAHLLETLDTKAHQLSSR